MARMAILFQNAEKKGGMLPRLDPSGLKGML
jgi:hypothetical protein